MARSPDRWVIPEPVRRELPWCLHCSFVIHEGELAHEPRCPFSQSVTMMEVHNAGPEAIAERTREFNRYATEVLCRLYVM